MNYVLLGLVSLTSGEAEKHPFVTLELISLDSDKFTSCGHGRTFIILVANDIDQSVSDF